jgi:hypothetical protein
MTVIGRRSASGRNVREGGEGAGCSGAAVPNFRDRFDEALAVPERNAELLQIGFGQLRQDFRVDLMLAEDRFVLAKADSFQPLADVHGRAPHGLAE